MLSLSATGYLRVKSVHVIAVISWMAGILYLPRLFVNHCGVAVGSPESELLKGMERRLLRDVYKRQVLGRQAGAGGKPPALQFLIDSRRAFG